MMLASQLNALKAELAQVEAAQTALRPDDDLGRIMLGDRLEELRSEVSRLEEEQRKVALTGRGRVGLVFGGAPVVDNIGVASKFAAVALSNYQGLVAAVAASTVRDKPLGERGILPREEDFALLVTDVVRGSFGFELAEPEREQGTIFGTALCDAIEESTRLVSATIADDETFVDLLGEVDRRIYLKLRQFVSGLVKASANLRIESDRSSITIPGERLRSASERMQATRADEQVVVVGRIWLLPHSRAFELVTDDDQLLKGKLARQLGDLEPLYEAFSARRCAVTLEKLTWSRQQQPPIVRYTVVALDEAK